VTVQTLTVAANSEDGMTSTALSTWDGSQFVQGFDGTFYKYLGLRFTGVAIPQGAQITSATLVLKSFALGGGTGTRWGSLFGHATDNAPSWSNTSRPDQITKTTASSILNYSTINDAILNQDVTAIIQEIVGRAGWVSGNALRIGGDPLAGAGSDGQAVLRDLDSSAYVSPLIISFVPLQLGGSTGRGSGLRSKWLRKPSGQGNVSLLMPKSREDARRRSALNWLLDRLIYRGRKARTKAYLGTRSDGQLYLGERYLF
jgi:hypothetical protein